MPESRVASWEVRRGRTDELEKTGTGTATVLIHDPNGDYDPSNSGSPYFGQLDGAPISLNLRNPVTDTWHTRFTGIIDEYTFDLSPRQQKLDVTLNCVDGFDYLAGAEMTAGLHGVIPLPAGVDGDCVFYDTQEVDDRIHLLLDDAQWPDGRRKIFSGNVILQEQVADSGYSFLAGIQDAVDGEWPGISNAYMDAVGDVVFHGRLARFTPDSVAAGAGGAWDFHRWKVGDGAAIAGDSTYAQARPPLHADRSLKMIYNAALIYPSHEDEVALLTDEEYQALVAGNINTDPVSIAQYGVRSFPSSEVRVLRHKTSGEDAWDQTNRYGAYFVENYAQPRTRPRQITVKSVHPSDHRAAATWSFLCGVEISDIIRLTVSHPGGGGFDEDFYVEGISQTVRPLQPGFDYTEVTCDVSPAAYWTVTF